MVVIDASATVDLLLRFEPNATRIRRWLQASGASLYSPHLIDLEVLHVLRRNVQQRNISIERGEHALTAFALMSITRYPHTVLRKRIWELRTNITAYDAAYIALAETLSIPLITTDGRLARAPGHRASVEFLGE